MAVNYEADGPVAIVTIDRPEVANAIDRPTAEALADAFRRFEEDDAAAVAVLTGAGGKFCAGADLKAMQEPGAPRASRVEPDGDGPVGPTRMLLRKAGDRRRRGKRRGRWPGAGDLVRPAGRRGGRRLRRLLPPLGHPADGRRNHSARTADRSQPRPRPDPDRARRQRRGGVADGPGQPARRPGAGAGGGVEAGARGGGPSPGGAAQRPAVVVRAVVAVAGRRARERVPPRDGDASNRRDAGRARPLRLRRVAQGAPQSPVEALPPAR